METMLLVVRWTPLASLWPSGSPSGGISTALASRSCTRRTEHHQRILHLTHGTVSPPAPGRRVCARMVNSRTSGWCRAPTFRFFASSCAIRSSYSVMLSFSSRSFVNDWMLRAADDTQSAVHLTQIPMDGIRFGHKRH